MPKPEFLDSIDAVTALEGPQTLVSLGYASPTSPFSDVPWNWIQLALRRDSYQTPQSETDGDAVLSESYSTTPTTSVSDVSVAEDDIYYYGAFYQYREVTANPVAYSADISRLFVDCTSAASCPLEIKVTGSDLSTNAASAAVVSAGSTFETDGVKTGDIFTITSGADAGQYTVQSVDSETQVTLSSTMTATAGSISFKAESDEIRLALGGLTYERRDIVYIYNTRTGIADLSYDFSDILEFGERIRGIVDFDDQSATQSLTIVTDLRYVKVAAIVLPKSLTDTEVSVAWDLDQGGGVGDGLRGGYTVSGVCGIRPYGGGSVASVSILDGSGKQIRNLALADGSVNTIYDLSGLPYTDQLNGLTQDTTGDGVSKTHLLIGNQNYLYHILDDVTSPGVSNILSVTFVRYFLTGAVAWSVRESDYFGNDDYIFVVDSGIADLDKYSIDASAPGAIWQQENVPDANTVGLWHFDGATPLADSSQYGNTAASPTMTHNADVGYLSDEYEATAATNTIDISAISGEFNGAEGSASLWYKADTAGLLSSGTRYMLALDVDASNRVRIGVVSGSLTFEYIAGGTTKSVAVAHPSPDTRWHQYKITWSSTADEVKGFVDGSQLGSTQTGLGTWAGSLATAVVGGASSDTAIGHYDEVRISDIARVVNTPALQWTAANTAHTYSGLSAATRSFNYRDEFFTPTFLGGDWMIRNDAFVEPTSENITIAENNELIFRQTSKELGDLGRLSRMFGLMIDRLHDDRKRFVRDTISADHMDSDYMDDFVSRYGLDGLDPSWSEARKRRFVRYAMRVYKEGGTLSSYHKLSKLLGFKVEVDTLLARRKLDSVPATDREDIPFDTMGSLDTFNPLFPLAILRFTWWKQNTYANDGAVSGTLANRKFTSASATFSTTAKPGSLLRVFDSTDKSANGDYRVVSVLDDNTLLIDQDWPTGSVGLASLTYDLNWEVKDADPYNTFLLASMKYVLPAPFRAALL